MQVSSCDMNKILVLIAQNFPRFQTGIFYSSLIFCLESVHSHVEHVTPKWVCLNLKLVSVQNPEKNSIQNNIFLFLYIQPSIFETCIQ